MAYLDTNILLYSLQDSANEKKAAIAQGILRREDLVFSIQVFQEFYVQATHIRRVDPLTLEEAARP
jgi:predicted nucleic acid-binding protein